MLGTVAFTPPRCTRDRSVGQKDAKQSNESECSWSDLPSRISDSLAKFSKVLLFVSILFEAALGQVTGSWFIQQLLSTYSRWASPQMLFELTKSVLLTYWDPAFAATHNVACNSCVSTTMHACGWLDCLMTRRNIAVFLRAHSLFESDQPHRNSTFCKR